MRRSTFELLKCPQCHGTLALSASEADEDQIVQGSLECRTCAKTYPIKDGIPRFVAAENYAHNFGVQWNMFRRTQLDSHSGHPISRDRFLHYTGWTRADLEGKLVLDAGCGAGRFA